MHGRMCPKDDAAQSQVQRIWEQRQAMLADTPRSSGSRTWLRQQLAGARRLRQLLLLGSTPQQPGAQRTAHA
jgi:hypothetical protein